MTAQSKDKLVFCTLLVMNELEKGFRNFATLSKLVPPYHAEALRSALNSLSNLGIIEKVYVRLEDNDFETLGYRLKENT